MSAVETTISSPANVIGALAAHDEFSGPAIEVRSLVKNYGDFEAVKDVDLDIAAGEIFGIIGPDGAGKTSVFQVLGGVMEPTSGEAKMYGKSTVDARPPTLNLVLLGFAMNPEVTDLRLGIVDESRTAESRELISAFTESKSFVAAGYYASVAEVSRALSAGELEAGIVVPSDFATKRTRGEVAEVQFLVDSVNSNTGGIAGGYAVRIIGALNEKISLNKSSVQPARAVSRVSLFYNAGLQNSWFIVTGMIGMLLVMLGSLVSSASMVKEKEVGTVEQLLMTPAGSAEIILAKMAPIFLLLSLDIGLSAAVGSFVFGLPIRGSFALLYCAGMLCVLSGIGIGTIVATFTRSQQQAQLLSFFVNPPLSMLSGATTPIEAMPQWMQPLTNLNPVKHFAVLARGVMLKGVGLEVLYPNFLALFAFTIILVGVSAWRFRKQLN